jgi:hypothetical protein
MPSSNGPAVVLLEDTLILWEMLLSPWARPCEKRGEVRLLGKRSPRDHLHAHERELRVRPEAVLQAEPERPVSARAERFPMKSSRPPRAPSPGRRARRASGRTGSRSTAAGRRRFPRGGRRAAGGGGGAQGRRGRGSVAHPAPDGEQLRGGGGGVGRERSRKQIHHECADGVGAAQREEHKGKH